MKSRTWLLLPAAAIILCMSAFYFSKETPEVSCADKSPQPVIVAFGDSLVTGQGATTKGGFVSLVSQASVLPIRNLGRGGDTTESAKARVPDVLNAEPDIVLVLLGGNDALRRAPASATQANLDIILTSIKGSGAQIVLLGVVGGLPFQDPYPAMYEELAEKHDAVYVTNVLSGLIGREEFMSDSIHPNEAGYARIAERVLPALQEACGKL